jgi:hypothetical protein
VTPWPLDLVAGLSGGVFVVALFGYVFGWVADVAVGAFEDD